jgi:uncharacterized membrane protein YozB (DUF420 family)
MFVDGTRRLLRPWRISRRWTDEALLQRGFALILVTALLIALHLITGEPVALLKVARAMLLAALFFAAFAVLYVARLALPA